MRRKCLVLSVSANDLLAEDFGCLIAPSWCGTLFGQEHRARKLRRECISGGNVPKAPSNVVVLIVSAARNVVIGDPALAVKFMHVIEAATKATFGHDHLNHKRIKAGSLFSASPAFVTAHGTC